MTNVGNTIRGATTLGGKQLAEVHIYGQEVAPCPRCAHKNPLRCSNHPPVIGHPGTYACLGPCGFPERCSPTRRLRP